MFTPRPPRKARSSSSGVSWISTISLVRSTQAVTLFLFVTYISPSHSLQVHAAWLRLQLPQDPWPPYLPADTNDTIPSGLTSKYFCARNCAGQGHQYRSDDKCEFVRTI